MTSTGPDIIQTVHQGNALWKNETHCTRAPPNSRKTMEERLAKITSLEAQAEKKGIIVEKEEAKATGEVIVILVIVIALGVPAKIKGVGKDRGVSTDRNFVNPDHPPNHLINGLKDSDPQFQRAYV